MGKRGSQRPVVVRSVAFGRVVSGRGSRGKSGPVVVGRAAFWLSCRVTACRGMYRHGRVRRDMAVEACLGRARLGRVRHGWARSGNGGVPGVTAGDSVSNF